MLRVLLFGLLLVLQAVAQIVPGRYLVELETPSLLDRRTTTAQTTSRKAAIAAEQQRVQTRLSQMGAEVLDSMDTVANLVSVRMPSGNISQLRQTPGVKAVHSVYRRYKLLDQAQVLHRVTEAWQTIGGVDNAGRGIKIGIIDTGIDPTHPAFKSSGATGEVPAGFPKFRRAADQTITGAKIIAARSYDDLYGDPGETSALDTDGHGTAVAMSAAGLSTRANFAQVSGMAPQAFLGAYRVFSYQDEGATDDVILRAINDAIADGMDVINLSLGSLLSDRTVDGLYASVFQQAADAGIIIVMAAGNDGPNTATVASPAYLPGAVAVAATPNRRVFEFPVKFAGSEFLGTPGDGPNTPDAITGQIFDVRTSDPTGLGCTSLPAQASGRVVLVDRGGCFFEQKINNAQVAGALAILVANNVDGQAGMIVGEATLPAMMITRGDGAAIRQLLSGDSGASVEVGFNGREVPRDNHLVSEFSGRGPSVTRRLKPDVAAIGENLYTATLLTTDKTGFTLQDGTSFSSPIVAGAAGVLKGYRPGLTATQYRSLLVNTAAAFGPESGGEFTPLEIGAGLLNLDAALRSSIAASEITLSFGPATGSINETRQLTVYNLGGAADSLKLEIVPQAGFSPSLPTSTLDIPAGESREVGVTLEASGLTPGVTQGILKVQSLQTGSELRIPYWFAVPSGEPARIDTFGTDPAAPRAGSQTEFLFRLIDTSGLTMTSPPIVTALSQGLTITETVSADAESPGLYVVRMTPAPGQNLFAIELGGFRQVVGFRAFGF